MELELPEKLRKPHVIIRGNPVDGFVFVGPFPTWSEASDHSENMPDSDWWITALIAPEEDES